MCDIRKDKYFRAHLFVLAIVAFLPNVHHCCSSAKTRLLKKDPFGIKPQKLTLKAKVWC